MSVWNEINIENLVNHVCFRYITSIEENAKEGTQLKFEGGLDIVEDLDKVSTGFLKTLCLAKLCTETQLSLKQLFIPNHECG